MLLRDTIWSWWSHPLAVGSPEGTWLSGVDRRGNNVLHRVDVSGTHVVQLPGPAEADDHNAAALAINPAQSTLLAAYSRHDLDTHVRVQAVHRATGTLAGAQTQVGFDGTCTYAQLLQYGGTVWLLTRVDATRWCFRTSTDWGATWSAQQTLIDGSTIGQNYITTRPDPVDPALIHVAHVAHPVNSSWDMVSYLSMRLDTGDLSAADGTVIGHLGTALTPGQLPTAIDPSSSYRVRVYDVAVVDGAPVIAYSVWSSAGWSTYHAKHWTGTGWVSDPWSLSSGAEFGHTPDAHYHGGMSFGASGQLWTSRLDGTVWRVEAWQHNGTAYMLVGEMAQAETRLIRPYAVRQPVTHVVAWQDCLYEEFSRYYGDVEVT